MAQFCPNYISEDLLLFMCTSTYPILNVYYMHSTLIFSPLQWRQAGSKSIVQHCIWSGSNNHI